MRPGRLLLRLGADLDYRFFYCLPAFAVATMLFGLHEASKVKPAGAVVRGFLLWLGLTVGIQIVATVVFIIPVISLEGRFYSDQKTGDVIGPGHGPFAAWALVVPLVVMATLLLGRRDDGRNPGALWLAAAASIAAVLGWWSVAGGWKHPKGDRHEREMLAASIQNDDIAGVQRAVRDGARLQDGALLNAVSNDHITMARYLVSQGVRDSDGAALRMASRLLYPDMVEYLLQVDRSTVRAAFRSGRLVDEVANEPFQPVPRLRIMDAVIAAEKAEDAKNPAETTPAEREALSALEAKSSELRETARLLAEAQRRAEEEKRLDPSKR